MVAQQVERDSRVLIAALVAMNVLALAGVVDLGEWVSALVLFAVSVVFITAVAVWAGRPLTALGFPRPSG